MRTRSYEIYIFVLSSVIQLCQSQVNKCVVCEYMGGTSSDPELRSSITAISHKSTSCLTPHDKELHNYECTGGQSGCGLVYMTRNITFTANGTTRDIIIQDVLRSCQFLIANMTAKCWRISDYDRILQGLPGMAGQNFSITQLFDDFHEILENIGIITSEYSEQISGRVCQCPADNCNDYTFHKTKDLIPQSSSTKIGAETALTALPPKYNTVDNNQQKSVSSDGAKLTLWVVNGCGLFRLAFIAASQLLYCLLLHYGNFL